MQIARFRNDVPSMPTDLRRMSWMVPIRRGRGPAVALYAALLFLLAAALISAVAVTLIRNAERGASRESAAELGGGARVGASAFGTLRANLRVQASQLATSLPLQRAVVGHNEVELRRIARARRARVMLDGQAYGALAPPPRISSTATITDGMHVLATVTIALPLGNDVLTLLRQATPLPDHAALMLVRNGRVIAGGPKRAPVRLRDGRVVFGETSFAAEAAPLGVADASVLAVQPVAAIKAQSAGYRRFVLLVALLTLSLAGLLAMRLARPVARVLGDVARLSRQAGTDALSGLANRRGLNERLDDELGRAVRNEGRVSFVLADIDNFKEINDGFGHQTGDNVIRAVGQALAGAVRELDFAARYGGEEFALILPGSSLADAKRTAERIRRAVTAVEVEGPTGEIARVTASFGIAEFPTYANAEALVAAADAALYQAKRSGKDRVAAATLQGQEASDDAAPGLPSLSEI
jgi:diguanylate cyclase (GGDEF)-like protein